MNITGVRTLSSCNTKGIRQSRTEKITIFTKRRNKTSYRGLSLKRLPGEDFPGKARVDP